MSAQDPSFMGRCDICGKPIDLSNGDRLSVSDGPDEEGYWDALANHVERQGAPGDYTLAEAMRDQNGYKAHVECIQSETSWFDVLDELDSVCKSMKARGLIDTEKTNKGEVD